MTSHHLKAKQILLVEDDWVLKHTLCKALVKKDYHCHTPQNAEEVFALLNSTDIRLVVADLKMSWINTLNLCNMMKRSKQFSHIPFIFISGTTDENEIKKAFMNGCDDYLTKPFHIAELASAIETLLAINGYQYLV